MAYGVKEVASGLGLMLFWAGPATAQNALPEQDPASTVNRTATPAEPGDTRAVQTGADGRLLYPAAYFTVFAPSTALDMVNRVPGFTLQSGDSDVRGFAQAAGNVVINGQRPSSKTDTLETILARIPASQVVRIEIGSGDLFGAEFTGKPQVVNLVLAASGGVAGNIDVTLSRNYTGRLYPAGSVSALLRRGPSTFNLSAEVTNDVQTEEGPDSLRSQPDNLLTEYRMKRNDSQDRGYRLAGSWAYDGGTNRTAHLNARILDAAFDLGQRNHVTPTGGIPRDDRLTELVRGYEYEIGGDVTRPLLGGGIKFIALITRRHRRGADDSYNIIDGDIIGGYSQNQIGDRQESVGRAVWSRTTSNGWTFETGAEVALNQLDATGDLYELSAGGVRTRIDLPISNARVRELRGEGFINVGRPLSTRLRVDGGLTYELSHLTVSGDAQSARSLRYLKPKLVLDWRPRGSWHAQVAIERTVAQLNFEDFISAAELASGQINGGNADLLPQRTWSITSTVDHPILGDGTIKLELLAQRVSQLQDRVPTPEGYDAPGNLGTGQLYQAKLTIDAPLDRLGIRGGRLSFSGRLQDSSVVDPYTHLSRTFSDHINGWDFDSNFRQDIGQFAWGIGFYGQPVRSNFRRDEVDRRFGGNPFVELFAEYRPSPRSTLRFGLRNVADATFERRRTYYAPDRTSPLPVLIEERARSTHVTAFLNFKHSIG